VLAIAQARHDVEEALDVVLFRRHAFRSGAILNWSRSWLASPAPLLPLPSFPRRREPSDYALVREFKAMPLKSKAESLGSRLRGNDELK